MYEGTPDHPHRARLWEIVDDFDFYAQVMQEAVDPDRLVGVQGDANHHTGGLPNDLQIVEFDPFGGNIWLDYGPKPIHRARHPSPPKAMHTKRGGHRPTSREIFSVGEEIIAAALCAGWSPAPFRSARP